jgi:hypothetical protein
MSQGCQLRHRVVPSDPRMRVACPHPATLVLPRTGPSPSLLDVIESEGCRRGGHRSAVEAEERTSCCK